jgi:hypothetical protein
MALEKARQASNVGSGSSSSSDSSTAAATYNGNGSSSGSSSSNGSSHSNGSSNVAAGGKRGRVTARFLVDCMGHWSPVVKQLRGGQRPDGMVLVVGGCWGGFPAAANRTADLLATVTDAEDLPDTQLFWEAFPAANGGRTTYMFAYSDAEPIRPSFAQLLDTYLRLLPRYQVSGAVVWWAGRGCQRLAGSSSLGGTCGYICGLNHLRASLMIPVLYVPAHLQGVPLESLQPQRILFGEWNSSQRHAC